MGLVSVSGYLETIGESRKRHGAVYKTYDYFSIRHADGTSTMVRRIDVPDDVDRILSVGQEVQFFVVRAFWFFRMLVGARVGARHAVTRFMMWSLPVFYVVATAGVLFMIVLLGLLGLIMMVTIVGLILVPVFWGFACLMALAFVYVALCWPSWRRKTLQGLNAQKFELTERFV